MTPYMCFLSVGKRVRNTLGLRLSETADRVIYESLPVSYTLPRERRLGSLSILTQACTEQTKPN